MEFACIYHGYIIYSLNNWLWFDIHFLRLFVGLFRRTDGKFLSEYVFREQSHALTVLHGLNEQRKSNTLCDVIICVEGEQFPCHRNILAACSPYFLAMFTGEAISIHLCLRYISKRKFLITPPQLHECIHTHHWCTIFPYQEIVSVNLELPLFVLLRNAWFAHFPIKAWL